MLAISHLSVLPSAHWNSVSALISDHFHGSIPCLHVPLSTLHVQPYDYPRMTRGQVGSLRLTCTTLSFATSRRFIPAHSNFSPTGTVLRVDFGRFATSGQLNHRDLRSGRWESNPHPKLGKLLNVMACPGFLHRSQRGFAKIHRPSASPLPHICVTMCLA